MDEDEKPKLTEQELWEYLHDELGLPVKRRAVKYAVLNDEITPTQISGCNRFSKRDGVNWIRSRKRVVGYKTPETRAAVGE